MVTPTIHIMVPRQWDVGDHKIEVGRGLSTAWPTSSIWGQGIPIRICSTRLIDEFILLPVSSLLPPYANKINIAEDCPARLINFLF